MARPRTSVEGDREPASGVDDRIRECSAMTLLLPITVPEATVPEADSEALREMRRRARDLYGRSRPRRGPPRFDGTRPALVDGTPPTQAELDSLWAMVPADRLEWARRIVGSACERARDAGTTATPQTIELDR